jgi:type IV pilus assembly protein PilN
VLFRFEASEDMRVRLNLATQALETHRRFLAGAGLTAFFAGLGFLALGWHVYSVRKLDAELRARTQKTRQEMARLEAQRQDLDAYFHRKDISELHDRADFINAILDARSFNWTLMFMDLERILPGGVRVISIEPKQVAGHVELKLTVGASSDETESKFEHALIESKQFTELQILNVHSGGIAGAQNGDQKVILLTTVYLRT